MSVLSGGDKSRSRRPDYDFAMFRLRDLNLSGLHLQDNDLAFLERLPALDRLFIGTGSFTGEFLRHLAHLPELTRLDVSWLSGCNQENLAQLNASPKLQDIHLTGHVSVAALASLTGPLSLRSLNVNTDQIISKQTIAELTTSHPALEYIRVNPVPAWLAH